MNAKMPEFRFAPPMTLDTSHLDRAMKERREHLSRQDDAAKIALASTAGEFCRRLVERMVEFEKQLDETKEVGLKLVSFGQTIMFHVRDIGYYNPSLILFFGVTEDGNPVELIQHVSQISFLLNAVKRLEPQTPREEMGFHTLYRQFQEGNA